MSDRPAGQSEGERGTHLLEYSALDRCGILLGQRNGRAPRQRPRPDIKECESMMQAQDTAATDLWFERGKALIECASDELNGESPDDGVISNVSLALACLKAAWGDPPAHDLIEHFDDTEAPCTCPPALVERGGWASTCPRHGP